MPRFVAILVTLLILLLAPAFVFAQENTSRIDLTINQGPGLLLPTSPFYFADVFKNNLRLLLATGNNGQKAKIHLDIAGERIAEVKVMLEDGKMTQYALNRALLSMVSHVEGAKISLKQAKNSGKNVERLASDLNVVINSQKDSLRILGAKTDAESGLKIKAELAKIREIETAVEDEMAADLRQNEVHRELAQQLYEITKDASAAADKAADLQKQFAEQIVVPTVAGVATQSSTKKETTKSASPKKTQPVEQN